MSQSVVHVVAAIPISYHFNHTLCLVILLVEYLYRRFESLGLVSRFEFLTKRRM